MSLLENSMALLVSVIIGFVLAIVLFVSRAIINSIYAATKIDEGGTFAEAQESVFHSAQRGFDLIAFASDLGTFILFVIFILVVIGFFRARMSGH